MSNKKPTSAPNTQAADSKLKQLAKESLVVQHVAETFTWSGVKNSLSPKAMAKEMGELVVTPGARSAFQDIATRIRAMVTDVRGLATGEIKPHKETFEEACERFDLTEENIQAAQKNLVFRARATLAVLVALIFWSMYLVLFVGHLAVTTYVTLFAMIFITTMMTAHAEFRAWQVINRKLAPFSAWVSAPDQWFV